MMATEWLIFHSETKTGEQNAWNRAKFAADPHSHKLLGREIKHRARRREWEREGETFIWWFSVCVNVKGWEHKYTLNKRGEEKRKNSKTRGQAVQLDFGAWISSLCGLSLAHKYSGTSAAAVLMVIYVSCVSRVNLLFKYWRRHRFSWLQLAQCHWLACLTWSLVTLPVIHQ